MGTLRREPYIAYQDTHNTSSMNMWIRCCILLSSEAHHLSPTLNVWTSWIQRTRWGCVHGCSDYHLDVIVIVIVIEHRHQWSYCLKWQSVRRGHLPIQVKVDYDRCKLILNGWLLVDDHEFERDEQVQYDLRWQAEGPYPHAYVMPHRPPWYPSTLDQYSSIYVTCWYSFQAVNFADTCTEDSLRTVRLVVRVL